MAIWRPYLDDVAMDLSKEQIRKEQNVAKECDTTQPHLGGDIHSLLSAHTEDVDTLSDDPRFQKFERDALTAMAEEKGGVLFEYKPWMRRDVRPTNKDSVRDAYRIQREKNNSAAKQSRDRRKLREIQLGLKVTFLKKEIAALKAQVAVQGCSRCHQPLL